MTGATGIGRRLCATADLEQTIRITGSGGVMEFGYHGSFNAERIGKRQRLQAVVFRHQLPVRVKALETGIIQAAPFSATERVVMERQGFPPFSRPTTRFPSFVVANRQKVKSKPAEIVSLLKGIPNSIHLLSAGLSCQPQPVR